jgi:CysZ protein
MKLVGRFAFGFRSFFMGFFMVKKHPSLLKYLIIPMLFGVVFLITGLYFSVQLLPDLITEYLPKPDSVWKQGLYWIMVSFAALSTFLLVILNSFILANIINIPINTRVCELLLRKEFKWQSPSKKIGEYVKAFIYFLAIGLVKTAIIVALGAAAFLLSFLPFLSLIAAVLGMLVLAFDCSDITFEIKEWGLRKRWQFFRFHKVEFLGFAIGIGLFSLIPGLNFILLPFIVLGASHMVHTLETRISHGSLPIT